MKRLFLTVGMLLGLRVEAQHWKPQDRTIWMGPEKLLFVAGNGDHATTPGVMRTARPVTERRLPPPPRKDAWPSGYSLGVQVAEGEIFYLHGGLLEPIDPEKDKRRKFKVEVFRFDEAHWKWETEPTAAVTWPYMLKPFLLSKDRMLAISMRTDSFTKDGKGYPFAVFRKNAQGAYAVDSYLDVGLDKPAIKSVSGEWNYPSLAKLWMEARVAFCGDQVVVGNGSGIFWVFTSKGSLRRTIRLYNAVSEEALQKGELWNEAVLAMQPRPDGDLLVSAHAEGTLDHVHRLLAETRSAKSGAEYEERRKKALDLAMWANPRVDWFVLDLDTGKVNLCPPPFGFPDVLKNAQAIHDFNWVFKPDGNLQLYSEKEMIKRDPTVAPMNLKRK